MSTTTFVVTGVSRGIGLEWLRRLSNEPSCVVIGLVRDPHSTELAQYKDAPNVHIIQADISNDASVESAIPTIEKLSGGKIDVLLNNAATISDDKGLEETPLQEYADMFSVKVIGTIRLTMALLPLLRKGHAKKVINTSSMLASNGWTLSNPSGPQPAYAVSKAALNMFGTRVAKELEGEQFVVIDLAPGYVSTRMNGHKGILTTAESVNGMMKVIGNLKTVDNGKFFDYDGTILPF